MDRFFENHLPFWTSLTKEQKELVVQKTVVMTLPVDRIFHMDSGTCEGVKLIRSGQVRVFMISDEGSEINLYRLVEGDICILSMAAMEWNVALNACVQAETESSVYMIPKNVCLKLSRENEAVRDFTHRMMAKRMGDIMNLARDVAFSSISKRLAGNLVMHMKLCGSSQISITHDSLAKDIGSSREVVSRTLKQFQNQGFIAAERGKITIIDVNSLESM